VNVNYHLIFVIKFEQSAEKLAYEYEPQHDCSKSQCTKIDWQWCSPWDRGSKRGVM